MFYVRVSCIVSYTKAFHQYVSYSAVQGKNACDLKSAGDILRQVVASEGPVFVGIDVSDKMVTCILHALSKEKFLKY